MRERLIVIGGVAAGMSAAAKARRINPQLEIVVYERSGYVSYGACGFPFYIKGEISDINKLLARSPEQFARDQIEIHTLHEVTAIHPANHTVEILDVCNDKIIVDRWDKLVIATGASVKKPPIPGIMLPGIFSLRTVEDALAIKHWLDTQHPQNAVIIGASFIGVEMAEALLHQGLSVTLIEQQAQVLPGLDPDMAVYAQEVLEQHGVRVLLNTSVSSFIGEELIRVITRRVTSAMETSRGVSVQAKSAEDRLGVHEVVLGYCTIPADIVILGVGGRPNTAIASAAGINLGTTGAIAVDTQMRTNIPGIWAAGAAAEAFHRLLNHPVYLPTAPVANKQGRIAGTNAAGGKATFAGVFGTYAVKIFDLTVAQSGLTERQATKAGYQASSATITSSSRAAYMPDSSPIHVKLVYQALNQRLLGAQMVGDSSVAKRIDTISAALQTGWNIKDLAELDMSYSPPFSPVWDPILIAANAAYRNSK